MTIVNVVLSLLALLNMVAINDLEYSVEKYELLGVCYGSKGVAIFYDTAWRTNVYVNLNKIDNETLLLKEYVHHVDILCQMTVHRNCTGCADFSNNAMEHLNLLTRTESLLKKLWDNRQEAKGKREEYSTLLGN